MGIEKKPPHPATVAQHKPPHAATAQRKAPHPGSRSAPPHSATVAQRRAPHPATVAQRRAAAPASRPHPATVVQRRAPHGATVVVASAPHPATVQRVRAPGGVAQRMDLKIEEVPLRGPSIELDVTDGDGYTGDAETTLNEWLARVFRNEDIYDYQPAVVWGPVYNLYAYGSIEEPSGSKRSDAVDELGLEAKVSIQAGFFHVDNPEFVEPSNAKQVRFGVHVKPAKLGSVMKHLCTKFSTTLTMVEKIKAPTSGAAAAARLDNIVIYFREANSEGTDALVKALKLVEDDLLADHPPALAEVGVKGVVRENGHESAGVARSKVIAKVYSDLKPSSCGCFAWLTSCICGNSWKLSTFQTKAIAALEKANLA